MTVLKQYNPDTAVWEVIIAGEPGPPGAPGVGSPGVPGPAGATGSGLFIWTAWGGPADTPLPDPPPDFSAVVTQSGGLYLISGTPPDAAPLRPDSSPAQGGDGMLYDRVAEEWVNVGPTRGPTGFGVAGPAGPAGASAPVVINAQTGTSYTLVLADVGKLVTLSNGSAITLTVPTNASVGFTNGTVIDIAQLGAGQVTVAGAGGVTVNSDPTLKLRARYTAATLVKLSTNTWMLVGDLAAS